MYLDTCRPETVLLWYFNDKLITTFYYVLSIYSIYTKVILNKRKRKKKKKVYEIHNRYHGYALVFFYQSS